MNDIHDAQRLKELQALPLERKVGFTIARITEWYNHYNGKVHVSFSGGKDSTVLLYITRKLFPEVRAMFVDTGLEYPEIREFVKTWDNVDWVKPKMSFLQVIKKYGYPVIGKEVAHYVYYARKGQPWASCALGLIDHHISNKGRDLALRRGSRYDFAKYGYLIDAPFAISDNCCAIMKKTPANKYAKDNKSYALLATMAEESRLRTKRWIQYGCNAFSSKHPISAPMSFWTEQDVLRYIKTMDIPIAKIYGNIIEICRGGGTLLQTTGAQRTGCMFCCFGVQRERCPNRFQQMYVSHPKQWDYCINKLGLKEVLDYIHVPYEPEITLFDQEQPDHEE